MRLPTTRHNFVRQGREGCSIFLLMSISRLLIGPSVVPCFYQWDRIAHSVALPCDRLANLLFVPPIFCAPAFEYATTETGRPCTREWVPMMASHCAKRILASVLLDVFFKKTPKTEGRRTVQGASARPSRSSAKMVSKMVLYNMKFGTHTHTHTRGAYQHVVQACG